MYFRVLSSLILFIFFALPAMAKTGILEIYSTPSGAEVFIDNIYTGLTPFSAPDIAVGTHQIKLQLEEGGAEHTFTVEIDDLKPQIHHITFRQNQPSSFNGVLEKPTLIYDRGNVQFASIPTGAQVEINGTELATTPVSFRDADTGTYKIRFMLGDKVLGGQFSVNKNETGKLIADFTRGVIINKWEDEKSKSSRKELARKKHLLAKKEQIHEEHVMQELKQLQPEVRQKVLSARDLQHQIAPLEEIYRANRSYYYSAIKFDPIVVAQYKLPYDRLTLEIKNLKQATSTRLGNYFEGEYVIRYGKHTRRGHFKSGNLISCRFTLYNDLTIKVRYDPDDYGSGKGGGKVFVSVR